MRLYSWNINGFRAGCRAGLLDWLGREQPDVLCLQETRVDPAELSADVLRPPGYQGYWAVDRRKGYWRCGHICPSPGASLASRTHHPSFRR